jgi:glyoxylase-like metal-dependent hydrolase (beta-lactamase superfamily II)
MAKIKVLIEGYAKKKDDEWIASSTTALIKENGINVIVDPGTNRNLLLKALENEGLEVGDINYVIITHYHLDHSFLAAIFPNAKLLDNTDMYVDDRIESHSGRVPNTDIKIIQTPGHAKEHCSVVVPTEKGIIIVAGDVFWWRDDEEQDTSNDALIKKDDPYVKDEEKLNNSRKEILEIADYIIPGHGKMFKVSK